mgnify:CR=1 FL=1
MIKLTNKQIDWYYDGSEWSISFMVTKDFDYSEEAINKLHKELMEDFKTQLMVFCGYYKESISENATWVRKDDDPIYMKETLLKARE